MEVFRLSKAKFARPLSGIGAAIKGARWNSKGVELIYTASNRSLAMAEVAVHFTLATLPFDYVMISIEIPTSIKIKKVDEKKLPRNWNEFPYSTSTQTFGNSFMKENKYCVLKVPSAVTKGDFNYLINPKHKDIKLIKIISIDAFPFDKRILK